MNRQSQKLPKELARYFWDVDAGKIDLVRNERYVIERLLEFGDTDAIRWILKHYSKQAVISSVKRSRQISPKTANFWALIYSIPREEVRCLEPSYLQLRKQVWPY